MGYKGINIKTLKSQLSVENHKAVMKALDIPLFSENSNELRYWTGDKNKNALDGSPGKLIFYKDTKFYYGYTSSCSYDIISLCQKRLGLLGLPCSFFDAVSFITKISGIDEVSIQRINSKKHTYDWEQDFGKFIRLRNGVSDLPIYDKSILPSLCTSVPQEWINEGISIESMQKYQIGYYERCNQTTIPCFNRDGELIGIRVRNWNPDLIEGAKYMPLYLLDGSGYKFPTENVFYGINFNWPEIERTKTCYIGESEKFVLKMDTWFGRESTALGMFGSNLGLRRRNEILKMGVERVVYVPDNDFKEYGSEEYKEWEEKIQKFIKLFKGYVQLEIVWDTVGDVLGYKENATDKDKTTWDLLYENRQIWKMKEGEDGIL